MNKPIWHFQGYENIYIISSAAKKKKYWSV